MKPGTLYVRLPDSLSFQYQQVRLKPDHFIEDFTGFFNFQYQQVRLKRDAVRLNVRALVNFQYQQVRLKLASSSSMARRTSSFNTSRCD